MKTATIEELAYLIKKAKKENLPQPIVFLGAGASKTGGIPLASEIVADILDKYKEDPKINNLDDSLKTYPYLMECLSPFERNKLLKGYIDNAKVNVTHIYLAKMFVEGLVDYVLTVNFDNLMLRALAFYNEFPPTYDMAILKDLTTTTFNKKSVVYLHGQHHGLWLLNTKEEMAKVNEIITPILNSIKDQRPWIFIGYSGDDPIFNHIKKLGRFDNGLYWVTYKENDPNVKVCLELLEKSNTYASLIKGYDSDSFMLKLNTELNLTQPEIIDKPFTSLKNTLEKIVDIDDEDHYKGVKERLKIAKENVERAISQFELGESLLSAKFKEEVDINIFKKQLIDKIVEEKYGEIDFNKYKNLNNPEINELLAVALNNWGIAIYELAKLKIDESLYQQSIKKYQIATDLNPNYDLAFNNWGNSISELAKQKKDESLYQQSIEKYKIATDINSKFDLAFNNWGLAIHELATLTNDKSLYYQSINKYQIATDINPNNDLAYYHWGNALKKLANLTNDEGLYQESFEKYKISTVLNSKNDFAFNNWGIAIIELLKLKTGKEKEILMTKGEQILKKGIELGSSIYNLSCLYSIWNKKEKALEKLEIALRNNKITVSHVETDEDWEHYREDHDFKALLKKFRT